MSFRDLSFEGGFVAVEGAELVVPTAERESKGGMTAAAMLPVSNTFLTFAVSRLCPNRKF
jgi:hypothetical protein